MIRWLPLSIMFLLLTCCLSFYFTACDVDFVDARPSSADAEASQEIFHKQVYPLFQNLGCSGCHTPSGKAKGHPFADADINNAHKIALTKVSFGNIEGSLLIIKAKDGHSGCNTTSGECDDKAEKLIAVLKKWHAGRGRATSNAIITDEKDINPDKQSSFKDKEITFTLNDYIRNVKGYVTLVMKTDKQQNATGEKKIVFSNFELKSTDDSIYLKGLVAIRNGKPSADQTLSHVCTLVVPLSDLQSKTKLISTQSTSITIAADDDDPDNIAFEIKELLIAKENDKCGEESSDNDGMALSQARAEFADNDIGSVIRSNCTFSCHNQNVEQGQAINTFDLFYSKRAEIARRVKCQERSPTDDFCMPRNKPNFTAKQKQQLLDWLAKL